MIIQHLGKRTGRDSRPVVPGNTQQYLNTSEASKSEKQRDYKRPIVTEVKPAKVILASPLVTAPRYMTNNRRILTRTRTSFIVFVQTFWPAEDYHQQYLENKGQSAAKGCTIPIRCYG